MPPQYASNLGMIFFLIKEGSILNENSCNSQGYLPPATLNRIVFKC